jgi:hypothetical protein
MTQRLSREGLQHDGWSRAHMDLVGPNQVRVSEGEQATTSPDEDAAAGRLGSWAGPLDDHGSVALIAPGVVYVVVPAALDQLAEAISGHGGAHRAGSLIEHGA